MTKVKHKAPVGKVNASGKVRARQSPPLGEIRVYGKGLSGPVRQRRERELSTRARKVSFSLSMMNRVRAVFDAIDTAAEATIVQGRHRIRLGGEVLSIMRDVAQAMDRGRNVTIIVSDGETTELSSQEAADLLNVSRPHVAKLADRGELPCRMVGNRRKFALEDVLAYEQRMRRRREEALAAIAPEGGYTAEDF